MYWSKHLSVPILPDRGNFSSQKSTVAGVVLRPLSSVFGLQMSLLAVELFSCERKQVQMTRKKDECWTGDEIPLAAMSKTKRSNAKKFPAHRFISTGVPHVIICISVLHLLFLPGESRFKKV